MVLYMKTTRYFLPYLVTVLKVRNVSNKFDISVTVHHIYK